MSVAIDEEKIFPGFSFAGAGFDLRHVDAESAKGREGSIQRSDAVHNAEHDAGAVISGGRAALSAKDKEPGCVCGVILNVLLENRHTVFFGGEHAGNGSRLRFLCSKFGGASVRRSFQYFDAWQMRL